MGKYNINNVKAFTIKGNALFFNNEFEVFADDILILKSSKSLQEIKYDYPFIYISDIYGNSFLIDKEVKFLEETFIDKIISDSCILVSKDDKTALYNIKKQTLDYLLDFNVFKFLLLGNHLFFFKKNTYEIKVFSLIQKEYIWEYPLLSKYNYFKEADYQGEPPVEVQAEVIKFLGVYKNELWLVLNSGLLALNIETGTETRYIKEGKMAVGEPFFEDFKGYFGYDTFLDEEKGIIFSLNLHFYIEYDLNSNKNHFDSYSFKDSSEKNGLHLNQIGGYDAENIYAYEGSKNNRFAIFSREKKEIIWSEEIPETQDKFPAIRDLQYGAGKIYVLDHYNTLHIFEEEI